MSDTILEVRKLVNERGLARPHCNLAESILHGRPGVVVDIGAHRGGMFPFWFAHGATRVIGFEPVPYLFDITAEEWGADKRVDLERYAISEGRSAIHGARLHGAFTLSRPGDTRLSLSPESAKPFDFETISLDEWLAIHSKIVPAMLKIDVDGYEPKVLRGAEKCLQRWKPPIFFELSFLPRMIGESCEAMVFWIYEHGYRVTTMAAEVVQDPVSVLEIFPNRTSVDVMLMPNELIDPKWHVLG